MNRRQFLTTVPAVTSGLTRVAATPEAVAIRVPTPLNSRGSFALDLPRVRFFSPAIRRRFSILMLADTHLFRDDTRGEPYRQFSGRMARAYNQTRHFQSGETTHPEECFEKSLALAHELGVDLLALVGDLFSFPSEAAIEWVLHRLETSSLPYLYTAGNHDWHYEGMPGSLVDLRSTWIERRLLPLYQGDRPLMAVRMVHGVRFVAIDNSTYEILPEQLDFFRAQVMTGEPLVLLVHIPLYAPGRSVGFGCGHPEWGAKTDENHALERRPRWPEAGHTAVTLAFYNEVFRAPQLLGILAGHIHRPSLDGLHGIPQVVVDANATGAYLHVEFLPPPR